MANYGDKSEKKHLPHDRLCLCESCCNFGYQPFGDSCIKGSATYKLWYGTPSPEPPKSLPKKTSDPKRRARHLAKKKALRAKKESAPAKKPSPKKEATPDEKSTFDEGSLYSVKERERERKLKYERGLEICKRPNPWVILPEDQESTPDAADDECDDEGDHKMTEHLMHSNPNGVCLTPRILIIWIPKNTSPTLDTNEPIQAFLQPEKIDPVQQDLSRNRTCFRTDERPNNNVL
ncbi:MAG: hypothetical protein Q9220_007317 [cf. Caloplaca sp. 1 TL-2023]